METPTYLQVAVPLNGKWRTFEYTYSTNESVRVGDIVIVPFGKKEKPGLVTKLLGKPPSFKTKPISRSTGYTLSKKTLQFFEWIIAHYPSAEGMHTTQFLPQFLSDTPPEIVDTGLKHEALTLPPLTDEQKKVLSGLKDIKKAVIHGITGSGKTRVYIEQIKTKLSQGNALVLVPEISLTPQLAASLSDYFGADSVAIYHSKLTKKQQYTTWNKAATSKKGTVFVGTRSALFLPFSNLSLLIVDEAHDAAYKQENGSKYSGVAVAAGLANQHAAQFISGSATPPIAETFQLLSKNAALLCMHTIAKNTDTSKTVAKIVDMKNSSNKTSIPIVSKPLLESIKRSLEQKSQILLYLNKRGTAKLMQCDSCGWVAVCKNCDLPLTFHHDVHTLRCHLCGFTTKPSSTCPDCGQAITLSSFGVKAIEEELHKLFPNAVIARFDSDNKKKDSLATNFHKVAKGEIDILIGTQLLTKGLDLPKLGLVGILEADATLIMPDYSSSERTFQQLTQVSGRVGRGHRQGSVLIQTYQPNNPLFTLINNGDWHTFYEQEVANRKVLLYPPHSYLLKITAEKKSEKTAENSLKKWVATIPTQTRFKILGPAPAFYEKSRGNYRWQVLVKAKSRKELVQLIGTLPADLDHDIDPVSLL